jgi:hypothetical protein
VHAWMSLPRPARFVFFAGLGGTGHHFWNSVLSQCKHCADARPLRLALQRWWFANHSAREHEKHHRYISHLLQRTGAPRSKHRGRNSKAAKQPGQPQSLWFLNVLNDTAETGMLSYPNKANAQFLPRIDWLASAAREARVNLTIVVLHRDAVAIESSVSRRYYRSFLHRWGHVNKWFPVAAAMTASAQALKLQLANLAYPTRLGCIPYEGLPNGSSAMDDLLCDSPWCSDWKFSTAAALLFNTTRTSKLQKSKMPPRHLHQLSLSNNALLEECRRRERQFAEISKANVALRNQSRQAS